MYSRRWLIASLVVLGLVGGCSQFNTNLTTQTSSSTLTFLSPQAANAGDSGFTITANGAGFVTGAIILWNVGPNQVQLTTTFVSSAQLTAPVPNSNVAAAGNVQVAVQIPGSAVSGASGTTATTTTEVSNLVNFTINPKPGSAPTVTSLSASTTSMPATPYCGATGFTLTVTGANFDSSSVVNWNGSQRATIFVNSGQLTASILPQDAAFPGTANVTVSNAAGPSNTAIFTMTTPNSLPAPGLKSATVLTPTSIAVGSPTFTLRVDGDFLPCTVVDWVTQANGGNVQSTLTTTYVPFTSADPVHNIPADPAHLNATVPAADLATVGTAQVFLFTLGPGGGLYPNDPTLNTGLKFTITP
jgi:hypothetical protein